MEDCSRGGVLDGRYELGRVLGYVAFGKVHYACRLRFERSDAIKVVDKGAIIRYGMKDHVKSKISTIRMVLHPNVVELYENKISAIGMILHPNVVELYEVMDTRSKIYLAMELILDGELFARISRVGRLSEFTFCRYFRQLIFAVDFCCR
ncbi:hypothetical protein Cni_G13648 [Canna indica]|uniref:Protein kinase domain-containing protein n=1 Tax=Canna indica TaxID=4628 RepID=A0AAQ3KCE9_9LILI|nr:hypothetical protein Cni_G13648 [Canna indica]